VFFILFSFCPNIGRQSVFAVTASAVCLIYFCHVILPMAIKIKNDSYRKQPPHKISVTQQKKENLCRETEKTLSDSAPHFCDSNRNLIFGCQNGTLPCSAFGKAPLSPLRPGRLFCNGYSLYLAPLSVEWILT